MSNAAASGPPERGVRTTERRLDPWKYNERLRLAEETQRGLLLLIIGSLTAWIPIINFFGSIAGLGGLFYLFRTRSFWGRTHARNVSLGIVLEFLPLLAVVSLPILVTPSLPQDAQGAAVAVETYFDTLLVVVLAFFGLELLGQLLVTLKLQNRTGVLFLVFGFASGVVLIGAMFLIVRLAIQDLVAAITTSGTVDAARVAAVNSLLDSIRYLLAVPSVLFAIAYYLAWRSIDRGGLRVPEEVPLEMLPRDRTGPPERL